MNSVNIVGRITDDPVKRVTTSGITVCQFTLAVDRPRVKDTTDFISCVAWRQSAEFLCNYGHKGDRVGISGVLTQRSFEDKNGNKRYVHEVVADNLELLANKGEAKPAPSLNANAEEFEEVTDDDLPF